MENYGHLVEEQLSVFFGQSQIVQQCVAIDGHYFIQESWVYIVQCKRLKSGRTKRNFQMKSHKWKRENATSVEVKNNKNNYSTIGISEENKFVVFKNFSYFIFL